MTQRSRHADASELADGEARRRIAQSLDETLIVEAAAGTGKTTALVERIVAVLAHGRAVIDGIVAVTFTEKAAGELKLRLREELEVQRLQSGVSLEVRARLESALGRLEEAHIDTIHGFCADLLREHPIEAGVDPHFTVLAEPRARRLYDEAFAAWFEHALGDTPDAVRRALRRSRGWRVGGGDEADGPVDRLRNAGWMLAEWRDFTAPWTRPPFDRGARLEELRAALRDFAEHTTNPASLRDPFYTTTDAARRVVSEVELAYEAGDNDGAEPLFVDLANDWDFRRPWRGRGDSYGPGRSRTELLAEHQRLLALLDGFRLDADADLAAALRDDLQPSLAAYEELKRQSGALDFTDLLARARDLVRDRDDVRRTFQARFACVFVDEFQDTDPLQAEILLLLSADDPAERAAGRVRPRPGALFIVGDPKQSIYRFRRADVGVYHAVVRQLVAVGAAELVLSTSFRAVPNLQRAINAAFGARMRPDDETLQAAYIPLQPWRGAGGAQPSTVVLPVPRPYGKQRVSAAAIEASLPSAVGAFIAWMLGDSGWQVADKSGTSRPMRPGDVCVLFRRFVKWDEDVTRPYLDALEARGIPHVLVGGRAFHEREEIETLRAVLTAIEWPDDELAVFATLRGALFAVGDEELLEYRHRFPRGLHPFRIPAEVPLHLAAIPEALARLAQWHLRRNRRSAAETVSDVLDATRAHVGFALRRAGEQVLANALHVVELARQYERQDGLSFRGFVDTLRDAAEAGDAPDAPIVEEGGDGVRLMTVHKAKGLEFPVVVLADLTAKLAAAAPSRHIDAVAGRCALRLGGWSPHDLVVHQAMEHARDVEEGVRLAYVAATRARDVLVVPAVGDGPFDGGWLSPLNDAIYPAPAARRHAGAVDGAPAFSRDSVVERPDGAMDGPHTVSPGRHQFADSDPAHPAYEVVWWDPATLHLDVVPVEGLRRDEVISKDVPEAVVAEDLERLRRWEDAHRVTVARASLPSHHVVSATEWAARAAEGVPEVADRAAEVVVMELTRAEGRASGLRFGTLVHAALATVPVVDSVDLATLVATHARVVGATPEEAAAAEAVLDEVRRHVVWQEAQRAWQSSAPEGGASQGGAMHVWRETPVTLTLDGLLVEGVVDLAYELDGRITVVDFKTDRADEAGLLRYRRQLAAYALAFERARGTPTRAVLLQV